MNEPTTTFREMLAPVEPAQFLDAIYRREPLHIPGSAAKVRGICAWDDFAQLLAMTSVWTDKTLRLVLDNAAIAPEDYCSGTLGRDMTDVLRPDPARLQHWLDQGATVVADLVETLSPGIRAAADALAMGLGVQVTCNAYCSQAGRQAFASHFDTMEVFALQVAGRKVWRVYEGRFEAPLERPGYNYPSFDQAHHDRARGKVALEVEMKPGDLLYIPRGVYHDALATSEACLHLSFGTTEATGLDFLGWFVNSLDSFELMRRPMPPYDDVAAHDAHVTALTALAAKLLARPDLGEQFREEQKRRAHAMQCPVRIPPASATPRYRVRNAAAHMQRDGKRIAVATDAGEFVAEGQYGPVARWMLERDQFSLEDLGERFGRLDVDELAGLVARALDARLLVAL
ncbi:MAG: cupin domain-containing protein [Pseudomonadota bacterium]|nr:cupin domain-containing protein [Pseudomonadota bacterium]